MHYSNSTCKFADISANESRLYRVARIPCGLNAIIAVDDNCSDGTRELAQKLIADFPSLRVMRGATEPAVRGVFHKTFALVSAVREWHA
jgi:hypothetical protein